MQFCKLLLIINTTTISLQYGNYELVVQLAKVEESQQESMDMDEIDENQRIVLIDSVDITGCTPLMLSIRNNNAKIATFLIDKVKNINAVDVVRGECE